MRIAEKLNEIINKWYTALNIIQNQAKIEKMAEKCLKTITQKATKIHMANIFFGVADMIIIFISETELKSTTIFFEQ